jgi:ATP-dependent helicase/nuclease subunit A
LSLKTSVTSAISSDATEVVEEDYSPYDAVEKTKDGAFRLYEPISTDEGITAHKILEHYDFKDGDFDGQINKMLNDGVLLQDELKAINLDGIKKALSLEVFKELANSKLYREQYFVCKVPASKVLQDYVGQEKIVLQGVIDMLAIKDDEAVIIDYKYSAKSRDKLLATYKKQLQLYKLAVETSLKIKVKRTALVSLLSGETVEVDF